MASKHKKDTVIPRAKQFLAFSDNRQTAAFFASYLGLTYKSALTKRVMYQVLLNQEEQITEGMQMKQFVKNLSAEMEKFGLIEEDDDSISEAWISVLSEISNYKCDIYSLHSTKKHMVFCLK